MLLTSIVVIAWVVETVIIIAWVVVTAVRETTQKTEEDTPVINHLVCRFSNCPSQLARGEA